jgi:hypothetical protein
MKNKCFVYISAIVLFSGLIQTVDAQQGEIGFANGITVAIKVEKNGGNQNLSNIFSSSGTNENIVHRVMIDKKNKMYVGYDLEITPTPDVKQFDVLIKPLSLNKDMSEAINKLGDSNNLSLRAIPKYPNKITVQDGDTIALDVLENPQTKEKISDLIKVTRDKQKAGNYFPADNEKRLRAFTINDVQMSLVGFEAYVNDEKVKFGGGGMSGSIIWIYFPNKGRFILSPTAQSNAGFQKIGVIDGKTITFSHEGANYRFVSNNPVLGAGGKWNLWVMFDPDYKPASDLSPETPFSFGAANKVEYLFDNR